MGPLELGHCRPLASAAWLWWSFPQECSASGWAKGKMLSVLTCLAWNCFCRLCLTAHQEKEKLTVRAVLGCEGRCKDHGTDPELVSCLPSCSCNEPFVCCPSGVFNVVFDLLHQAVNLPPCQCVLRRSSLSSQSRRLTVSAGVLHADSRSKTRSAFDAMFLLFDGGQGVCTPSSPGLPHASGI